MEIKKEHMLKSILLIQDSMMGRDICLSKWNLFISKFQRTFGNQQFYFIVIYKALCFDVAQGRMNWAPNENRTHSCRFASLAC